MRQIIGITRKPVVILTVPLLISIIVVSGEPLVILLSCMLVFSSYMEGRLEGSQKS